MHQFLKNQFFVSILSVLLLAVFSIPSLAQYESTVTPEYVRNFFGAVHLNKVHHEYAEQVGAAWGRVGIQWRKHEPAQGDYRFVSYDSLINSAKKHNLSILPVLNSTAPWASSAPDSVTKYRVRYVPSAEHTDDWKNYVEKVVTRYPNIEYFEVWNEPNIDWFLHAKTNYKSYVDSILIPAAEVIHKHGRKVVGPSFTTEWPLDSWPATSRPRRHSENVASNIKAINQWLSYHDAWKYIDILSIHYTHGDTEKPSYPYADNMMPFYDYVYEKWIKPGKIDGIWNTEAGFSGTEAGKQGFVALDRWEKEPLAQWAVRYTVPILHWGIQHNWRFRDQYKVFWYHMKAGEHPRSLLNYKNGKLVPAPVGKALKTARDLLSSGSPITTYSQPVHVGFGLHSKDTAAINYFTPYEFKNYAFKVGDNLLTAVWMDLEKPALFKQPMQAIVKGLKPGSNYTVHRIHYIDGTNQVVAEGRANQEGELYFTFPPKDDPIIYLKIK